MSILDLWAIAALCVMVWTAAKQLEV